MMMKELKMKNQKNEEDSKAKTCPRRRRLEVGRPAITIYVWDDQEDESFNNKADNEVDDLIDDLAYVLSREDIVECHLRQNRRT